MCTSFIKLLFSELCLLFDLPLLVAANHFSTDNWYHPPSHQDNPLGSMSWEGQIKNECSFPQREAGQNRKTRTNSSPVGPGIMCNFFFLKWTFLDFLWFSFFSISQPKGQKTFVKQVYNYKNSFEVLKQFKICGYFCNFIKKNLESMAKVMNT